ncbi:MAG: hypothetical protein HQK77_18170 [Desulfobacterales bacterium]|nr:hypothetical protein [Desulfobacterales bacterium]
MFRNLLWLYIYRQDIPLALTWTEIIVSCVIALIFIALYWVFKRLIFFTINDNITNATIGAWLLSLAFSSAWLIASLNVFGFWSAIAALSLFSFLFIVNLIYLFVTRNK